MKRIQDDLGTKADGRASGPAGTGSSRRCLECYLGLQPAGRVEVGFWVLPTGTRPSTGDRCEAAPPSWALGTLHTWHLQMRSQRGRKELLLPTLWGGLSQTPPHPGQPLQHCRLPTTILVEGGPTFPGLPQSDEADQALPNWVP